LLCFCFALVAYPTLPYPGPSQKLYSPDPASPFPFLTHNLSNPSISCKNPDLHPLLAHLPSTLSAVQRPFICTVLYFNYIPSPPPSNMSAMNDVRQQVYVSDDFSEPMSAQHNFANNFDLNDPESAMTAYQKIMHEHTKRQLTTATDSARRRSGASSSDTSVSTTSP
ncbi:hypothetical protein IAQ61_003396, partial [Plenodomus lingam]